MTATIFTSGTFWLGFIAGFFFLIVLAYLYNYASDRAHSQCNSCYSDVKNERYMTWVKFPDNNMRLIKCSDKWHDE